MKHIILYTVLISTIGYLFIQNRILYTKKDAADSLLKKSLPIINSFNRSLMSDIKDIKSNFDSSFKVKFVKSFNKIDSINNKCNSYHENDFHKKVSENLKIHDSLLSICQNFTICPPKFDSKYLFTNIVRNQHNIYNEGDTAIFLFSLITNSYILNKTWTIIGCSNSDIINLSKNDFELKIPTSGLIKNNQNQVHVRKIVQFYMKNNYTNTLDTLRTICEFYVIKTHKQIIKTQ